MKKHHITIGIPAYNEEANISHLLNDLLRQNKKYFAIESIYVVSDGSQDKTVKYAKKFAQYGVKVINNKMRQGAASVQNQILAKSNTETLVLLNADIMITDKNFLTKLIDPIINHGVDLSCSSIKELKPQTFTENVIFTSMKLKNSVFEKYKNGNNIYTCHGTARAFSKELYKQLKFSQSVGEDAYSYLFCKSRGYKYKYAKKAELYYRAPNNYQDHKKQSLRFMDSKKKLSNSFGKEFVEQEYKIPTLCLLYISLFYLIRYPVHMLSYSSMYMSIRIKSMFKPTIREMWDISKSSKVLR